MGLLKNIFGTHSDRELKRIIPLAQQVEQLADTYPRHDR